MKKTQFEEDKQAGGDTIISHSIGCIHYIECKEGIGIRV